MPDGSPIIPGARRFPPARRSAGPDLSFWMEAFCRPRRNPNVLVPLIKLTFRRGGYRATCLAFGSAKLTTTRRRRSLCNPAM